MEMTDKMIEDAIECGNRSNKCVGCDSWEGPCYGDNYAFMADIARALQAERAKPKVWDGAPGETTIAKVYYYADENALAHTTKRYTRTLPKTRAREIAEETTAHYLDCNNQVRLEEEIESAILKREAELKEAGE